MTFSMSQGMQLQQRQALHCSICGTELDSKKRRERLVLLRLFGRARNWINAWVAEGRCPAPWCLGDISDPPEEVLRRFRRRVSAARKPRLKRARSATR